MNSLDMFYHVANIGDAQSGYSSGDDNHQQLTQEEQLKAGVTPGYVRLSIGIEHIDDIIGDLEQALQKA